jgi:CBS domain-containing protein
MIKAAEIMTKNVTKISGATTVDRAVKLMQNKGISSFIVDRRHPQDAYGIVTETDIVSKVIAYGKDPQKVRVYEIMTKPCLVINPELGVEYVARLLTNLGVHCAPVIKDELLGIISLSDIINKSDFLENPKSVILQQEIEEAIQRTRDFCADNNHSPQQCIAAWKIVEEMQAEAAHQQATKLTKTALEEYCEENPEFMEISRLDNWCSG